MRRRNEGWRTLRSGGAPQAPQPTPQQPGLTPAASAAQPARPATGRSRRVGAPPPPVAATVGTAPLTWPWTGGVGWTLPYVAFLYYILVVVTYRVSGADIAIAVALIGIPFTRAPFSLPPFLLFMGGFVLWCLLGFTTTNYPKEVHDQVLLISKIWLIALVAVNALRSPAQIRFYSFVFLGGFMLFPARGAIVNYLGGYTVWGRALWNYIYANPNDLAALALLPLSIGAGLLKVERFRWTRYLTMASVAILPLLILMTQSRGGFLALAVFGGVYLLGQRKRARTLFVMGLLAVAVIAIAPRGVWERVRGLGNATSTANLGTVDREGSARQRFEIWRVAFSLIQHNPISGVGFGAYGPAHAVEQVAGGFDPIARGPRDTHSTYLNVAAETGIPGLILFLGTVVAALVGVDRIRRRWKAVLPDESSRLFALELGLVAFMLAGLFGSFSRLSFVYLHMAYMYAAARAVAEEGAAVVGAAGTRAAPAVGRRRGALAVPPAGVRA